MNRPVFKVLDEKTLAAIAQAALQSWEDLDRIGLTPRQVNIYGHDLLFAVRRGQQAEPVRRTRQVRPSQAYIDRLDALGEWRKQAAKKMGVDSDIVLPRPFMYAIAERDPKTTAEIAEVMPNSPWRMEHYGAEILSVIRKKK
jgi:ribonuclease D